MGIGLSVTLHEASDGRQIVHYDGQLFEFTPSPGAVICSAADGTAIHHRKDCEHIASTADSRMTHPDPDGGLWRQLLETAPADQVAKRQAFTASAGLRNGQGRPVSQVCATCTLVPLSTASGIPLPRRPLSTALAEEEVGAQPAEYEVEIDALSPEHVRAFILFLSGESTQLAPLAARERLKHLVEDDGRFQDRHSDEVVSFLYSWADPGPRGRSRPEAATILKVAPGPDAVYWDECLAGGYICIGWEDVGDLTEFGSEPEFRAAFAEAYFARYKGNKSKISAKANELWRLHRLEPGDLVVANKGTKEILGVGTVTEDGYKWRAERETFQHTVAVTWDTGYAQILPEPQKYWGWVAVAKVPATLWEYLHAGTAVAQPKRK